MTEKSADFVSELVYFRPRACVCVRACVHLEFCDGHLVSEFVSVARRAFVGLRDEQRVCELKRDKHVVLLGTGATEVLVQP